MLGWRGPLGLCVAGLETGPQARCDTDDYVMEDYYWLKCLGLFSRALQNCMADVRNPRCCNVCLHLTYRLLTVHTTPTAGAVWIMPSAPQNQRRHFKNENEGTKRRIYIRAGDNSGSRPAK
jgi:hypothetical protein